MNGDSPEDPALAATLSQIKVEEQQDLLDAQALYRELESRVIPYFFGTRVPGASPEWTRMMKASIATIAPRISARRMARDYALRVYAPAAKN